MTKVRTFVYRLILVAFAVLLLGAMFGWWDIRSAWVDEEWARVEEALAR